MVSDASKLRVAYLNFSHSGGMLHYVLNLAEAAAEHADICYVDVGYAPTRDYAATGRKTLFFRWPSGNRILNAWNKYRPKNFRQLAERIAAELEPDVVHITSSSVGLLALVKHLQKLSIATIYTLHDPEPHDAKRTLWGTIYTRYQSLYQNRAAYEYCTLLHVHSELHRETVARLYGEHIQHKTYVVAHGGGAPAAVVNGRTVAPELSHQPLDAKFKMLFFGRIEPYKGLDYLFKAQQVIAEQGRTCQLIVAGSGQLPAGPPLPTNTVLIHRFIADDEIRSLLESCDVVILPYTEGTQSGVIPLAYHFEKPVICTRVGALPEMVDDTVTGLLIESKNVPALTQAIITLLDTPELAKQMGSAGKLLLENKLSWNKVIQGHLDHYLQINNSDASPAESLPAAKTFISGVN